MTRFIEVSARSRAGVLSKPVTEHIEIAEYERLATEIAERAARDGYNDPLLAFALIEDSVRIVVCSWDYVNGWTEQNWHMFSST